MTDIGTGYGLVRFRDRRGRPDPAPPPVAFEAGNVLIERRSHAS